MTRPVAVLDANVLYGIVPTDLLNTLAIRGIYRPHWTDAILDEAIRNITTNRPDLDPTDIARRFELMNRALPSATSRIADRSPVEPQQGNQASPPADAERLSVL